MADSDKIKASVLSSKDPFKDIRESAEATEKVLLDVEKGLKGIIEINKKRLKEFKEPQTSKDLEKTVDAINKVNKATEGLNKIQEEKRKLEQKLKEARKDSIQGNEELKVQLTEQRKINKNLAKEKLGLVSAYQKESKRLNDLRKQYKDFAVLGKENTEESRALLNEIEQLDAKLKEIDASVGQYNRETGNYKEATKAALEETDLFSSSLDNLSQSQSTVINLLGQAVKGLQNLRKSEDNAAKGAKGLGRALKASGIGLLIGLLTSLTLAFSKTREGQLAFQQTLGAVQATLGVLAGSLSEFGKGLINIGAIFIDVFSAPLEFLKGNLDLSDKLSAATDKLAGAFDNFGQRVSANVKGNNELIKQQFIQLDTTRKLEREIANLNKREELQSAIADDATLSFKAREEAIQNAVKLRGELVAKERELAEVQLKFAEERLKIELRESGILGTTDEQIRDLISLRELSGKVSEDALEAQQLAVIKSIEVEKEFTLAVREQNKTISELKQDRLERDLDILIDGFDNQKTINERIIADDKKTIQERSKLLEETVNLSEASFRRQGEIIEEFTDKQLDLDDLVATSDAELLNDKIRNLELSEIIEGRLLEIVRDRKSAVQDLTEAERDLNIERERIQQAIDQSQQNVEIENLQFRIDLLGDTEDAIKESFEIRKDIIEDQAEFEKDIAKQTIIDAEELAEKIIEIENKKNNDIARLDQDRAKAAEDLRKKELEDRKKFISDVISQTQDELSKINELRNDSLSEQVSDKENQLRLEEQLAINGRDSNLAFQRQSLEEARLIQKEELKKQQQDREAIKLAEIFLEAYLNRLSAGENAGSAAASAVVDVTTAKVAAKAIAGTLSSFKDGTDDTGTVSNPLDADGGRVALIHNNEAIYSKAERAMMNYRPRNEVVEIVRNHDRGQSPTVDTNSIVKAIERMPRHTLALTDQKEIIETIVEDQVTKIMKHRRNKLKW